MLKTIIPKNDTSNFPAEAEAEIKIDTQNLVIAPSETLSWKEIYQAVLSAPTDLALSKAGVLLINVAFYAGLRELGSVAQESSGLTMPMYILLLTVAQGLVSPISIMNNQNISPATLLQHGYLLSLTASSVLSLAFLFTDDVYQAIGTEKAVVDEMKKFVYTLIPGVFAYSLSESDSQYLLAKKHRKMNLFLSNLSQAVMAVSFYTLALGIKMPAIGLTAVGASLALGAALKFLLARLYFLCHRKAFAEDNLFKNLIHPWQVITSSALSAMFKMGFKSAGQALLEPLSSMMTNNYLSSQGVFLEALASQGLFSLVNLYQTLLGLGLGLGIKQLDTTPFKGAKLTYIGASLFTVATLGLTIPATWYTKEISALFTGDSLSDIETIDTSILNLRIVLITCLFNSLRQSMKGALTYLFQDITIPTIQNIFFLILMPIPLNLLLKYVLGLIEEETLILPASSTYLLSMAICQALASLSLTLRYTQKSRNHIKTDIESIEAFPRDNREGYCHGFFSRCRSERKDQESTASLLPDKTSPEGYGAII